MEQFWKKKGFRNLARQWNKKLAESGFDDAEVELRDDRALKQRASNSYRQANQLERESRFEYYSLLGELSNKEAFPTEMERLVMLKHSDGMTIKEICIELYRRGISRDRKTIRYIIRRWQMKWGVKTWTLRQMNLKKITD